MSYYMDQDLADLQEEMGWTNDTLMKLLVSFVQHEVLDGRCIDYLRAVAEEEKEMGLEDANDLAKYVERLVEGQKYEGQQPDGLLEGLDP